MNPWLGILSVLAILSLLMGLTQLLRPRMSPELSRKAVHVGMGLVCLSFPWIFRENWPVLLLAVLAIAGLAATRLVPFLQKTIGSVLGGVQRRSLGEFYFPMAVATVFALADGSALLYIIPVLTLTVADSVGALIGVRYGFARYQTDEGLKSAEGSVAFFTAAFLTCHIPLLLFSEVGRAESLLIALMAGFVVMLLEAISWRGQDNLIIPIGMFALLKIYMPLSPLLLLHRLLVVVGLVLLVLAWRKRTTLSDSAVLAGALSGYAVWAFGGWLWLLPPLLLFFIYTWMPKFPQEARPMQNLHAVTRVMAGGFIWLLLYRTLGLPELLTPYFLGMAAHTGNILSARLRALHDHRPGWKIIAQSWLVATGLFAALGAAGLYFGAWPPLTLVLLPVSVLISTCCFYFAWPLQHTPDNRGRVWLSETVIAFLSSLPGILI